MLKSLRDELVDAQKLYSDTSRKFMSKKCEIITDAYKTWVNSNIITDDCLHENYICEFLLIYEPKNENDSDETDSAEPEEPDDINSREIYISFQNIIQPTKLLQIHLNKKYRIKTSETDFTWQENGDIYRTGHDIKYRDTNIYKTNDDYELDVHYKITSEINMQLFEVCEYLYNFIVNYEEFDILSWNAD
jgi:hypothetical protein